MESQRVRHLWATHPHTHTHNGLLNRTVAGETGRLRLLFFSCPLRVPQAFQLQHIIICIYFIEEAEIRQHGLPSHTALHHGLLWISQEKGVYFPSGEESSPTRDFILSHLLQGFVLHQWSSNHFCCLTSPQPIDLFYFPHPCPNVPPAFLYYQPFTFKSGFAPSTLLRWFSQNARYLPNPLAFPVFLPCLDISSIRHSWPSTFC